MFYYENEMEVSRISLSVALSFSTLPPAHTHQFQETMIREAASVVKACLLRLAEILGERSGAHASVFHQVLRCLRRALSLLEGFPTPFSPGSQQNHEESERVLQGLRRRSQRVEDESDAPSRAVADTLTDPPGQGTSSGRVRESPAGPEPRLGRKRRLDGEREEDVGGGRHQQQEELGQDEDTSPEQSVALGQDDETSPEQSVALGQNDDTSPGQSGDCARSTGSGWIRQYTASSGTWGETAVTWVRGACRYEEEVSSRRRGELFNTAKDRCQLYARRMLENLLDRQPAPPIPRIKVLLGAATRHLIQPGDMDPDHPEFTKQAVEYIHTLLLESHRVQSHALREIGHFMEELASRLQLSLMELRILLCNRAATEKADYYARNRDTCAANGCSFCADASEFDRRSPSVAVLARPFPCRLTQEACRLEDYKFENFTRTFLEYCGRLAHLPDHCSLLGSTEPYSQVRDLVGQYQEMQSKVEESGMATILTGRGPVFPLGPGEQPVEAVQYVDGDGGYIVAELFPGFLDHLHTQAACPSTVPLRQHGYTLVPFREQHHDAIELGHEYQVVAESQSGSVYHTHGAGYLLLGYDALIAARGNLSRARGLWVVPSGRLDRFEIAILYNQLSVQYVHDCMCVSVYITQV